MTTPPNFTSIHGSDFSSPPVHFSHLCLPAFLLEAMVRLPVRDRRA